MGLCLQSSSAAARGLLVTLAGVALSVLAAWPVGATPRLAPPSIPYATGAGSRWVTTGDVDLDGVPDLVTANTSENTVSVLIGRGDGTFLPRVDSPTGVGPEKVMVADLDADGRLDAVTLNPASGTVTTLMGTGSSAFGRTTDMPLGRQANWLAIGDLDRDGLPDLVTEANNAVSVMLGHGDGTFSSGTEVQVGHAAGSPAIGDLDGDGIPDLVVAEPQVWVVSPIRFSVMHGNGDGTFRAGAVQVGSSGEDLRGDGIVWSVVLADMNRDGKLDVVGAALVFDYMGRWGAVCLFSGNGDGTFSNHKWLYGPSISDESGVQWVVPADLNGDRELDIVVTTRNAASACLGRGNGTFGSMEVLAYSFSHDMVVAIDDLNGDGVADMAGVYGTSMVSVLLANGHGGFGRCATTQLGFSPISVTTGDVNGDGRLDIVATTAIWNYWETDNQLMVLIADGQGRFAHAYARASDPAWDGVMALGDLNGDQRIDLAATRGRILSVGFGDGSGSFGHWTDVDGENAYHDMAIGDLNGDGHGDLVALGSSGGAAVLLGNGDGTFVLPVIHEPATVFRYVLLEDLDGDGHADLAATKAGAVTVMLGDGAGGFSSRRDNPVGHDLYGLKAGDLNGDATVDLLSVGAGTVSTLLGRGDGSLDLVETHPAGGPPSLGDLDADGKPDVSVALGGVHVVVMPGVGDGRLDDPFLLGAMGVEHFWTEVHDWNGDGSPDLAVASAGKFYYPDDSPAVSLMGAAITVMFGTPIVLSLAGTEVTPDRVRFTWTGVDVAGLRVLVYRAGPDGEEWSERGSPTVEGGDRLVYEDRDVVPGARYGYRLAIWNGTAVTQLEPAWVTLPRRPLLSLSGTSPNPATEELSVTFRLPDAGAARLELFDLSGRRIAVREVGSLGEGEHRVSFGGTEALRAGVYLLRLSRGRQVLTAKACVVR